MSDENVGIGDGDTDGNELGPERALEGGGCERLAVNSSREGNVLRRVVAAAGLPAPFPGAWPPVPGGRPGNRRRPVA